MLTYKQTNEQTKITNLINKIKHRNNYIHEINV